MADSSTKGINPLSHQLLRNLGDRSYEKRKSASLEIQTIIQETIDAHPEETTEAKKKVHQIIGVLSGTFASSKQANQRKGGLIGLAATAIALGEETDNYLGELLPPVLHCFLDPEARVRYYACEALYNIAKVARGSVLVFFNEIFDGLCKLCNDPDIDVRNGVDLLDRLLRDVVSECEEFDVEKYIPLLKERISNPNKALRLLLIGWIIVLDSVPSIDILPYLPEYLDGIFGMLSDQNKDIRQYAYSALAQFLKEISQTNETYPVDLGSMVPILINQCESKDNFSRLTALTWINEFIQLGKAKLLPFSAAILGACLHCISDVEEEIRHKAQATNAILLQLVREAHSLTDIQPLLDKLLLKVSNKWVPTRLASLQWINTLLKKFPSKIFESLNELFPPLLQTLSDSDEEVVRLDLEILARISLDDAHFEAVLKKILELFASNKKLLEKRGSLIIRHLCVLLDGESIYRSFSKLLLDEQDLEFASIMIQTLNLILLTSAELLELRSKLKSSLLTEKGLDLFVTLYKSWAHNPVATFCLCLITQVYELASSVVFLMSDIEVTVGFLMQMDKLVQLIESPIFVHLRLQLLEPNKHPFLIKSLYGLLMLLPQSSAFASLRARLETLSGLAQIKIPESEFAVSSNPLRKMKIKETDRLNFKELLEGFKTKQSKHSALRKQLYRQHSLTNEKKLGLKEEEKTN